MNGKKDISKLNRRITIKEWAQLQDAGAGSYYSEISSFDTWAEKKNVTGFQFNTESHQQFQNDTVFTVRYNPVIKTTMTVDDETGRWLINSIEIDNEGYKEFMKLKCSSTDINIS